MSCPDPLTYGHARVLRLKHFKRLIKNFLDNPDMKWDHASLDPVRHAIRASLRKGQKQHCFYCRRLVKIERRNMGEAIEHFLDKSRPHYRKWAFHPLNLLYSCQPCNMVKATIDMGDVDVQAANYLQPGIGAFKWLHPYFDSYKENIKRTTDPFFSAIPSGPRYNEAVLMIKELHLNDIANRDDRYQQVLVEIQRLQDLMADVALRSSTFKSQVRYTRYIQAIRNRLRLLTAELS